MRIHMRKALGAIGISLGLLAASSAVNETLAQAQHAFRVILRDKAGSPGVGQASQFLSPRSLARRAAFGIGVDESDRPVSQAYIDTVLNLTGGVLHLRSKWLNEIVVLTNDSSDMLAISGKPWITATAYIAYYPSGLHSRPAGGKGEPTGPWTSIAKTAGSAAYYGEAWNQTNLVRGDYLHDLGFKGASKLIAVLDAGFNGVNTHGGFATLISENRLVDTYDFVRATNASVFNHGQHGTQVLSVMAGDTPGTYVGSAPEAQYALYITEDNGSEQATEMDNLVAGAERADSIGADVINVSLGYNSFGLPGTSLNFSQLDGKTTIAARGANAAARKGILFVTTAGNEGGTAWDRILTPGDADSALVVGSVDVNRQLQGSTGTGPNAAGIVKPDIVALGVNAAVFGSVPGTVVAGTGTSFAAPNIAGFAACLMEARPGSTPAQIINAINRSADLFAMPTPKHGHGVPNFQTAYGALSVAGLPAAGGANRFNVSPNPVDGAASLAWKGAKPGEELTLLLIDAAGRIAWRSSLLPLTAAGSHPLDMPQDLPAGLYALRIAEARASYTLKLVVR